MQVKATCGICQGNCKVVLTVEDGKIVKVEPDRESPRGRACFRGVHAPDILYGEQRLKKPLIRVGEKGERMPLCFLQAVNHEEGEHHKY